MAKWTYEDRYIRARQEMTEAAECLRVASFWLDGEDGDDPIAPATSAALSHVSPWLHTARHELRNAWREERRNGLETS